MTVISTVSSDHLHALSRPPWPPPRSPLPPHRLAKLANALGVPTPLPATSSLNLSATNFPSPSPSFSDSLVRSQTPSSLSTHTFMSPLTSKYLLHVIPPTHLPHAAEPDGSDLTPAPPSASGYHTKYERGTLIPLHPTLQGQLLAIAKEYALPSTVGLVLYLVSSTPGRESVNPTPNFDTSRLHWDNEEPGPRISDIAWRHIWTRVVKVEREEALSFLSRTGTPDVTYPASLSSPSLLLDSVTSSHSLRRFVSSPHKLDHFTLSNSGYPITPSPTTPSSAAHPDVRIQSDLKVTEPCSVTVETESDVMPSPTSLFLEQNADAPELPGLNSPSLIPVLAKVEFEIDRQKAAWYEPWLRSRRLNHAKRAESRARGMSESNKDIDEEEKKPPIDLRLVARLQAEGTPEFLREHDDGYYPLGEVDYDNEDEEEEITSQFPPVPGGKDPLADIFGTDAEMWAKLQAEKPHKVRHLENPNIVDLALDGAALSAQVSDDTDENTSSHDEREVEELWDQHSRPQLALSISSSQSQMPLSDPAVNRKHVPPRLHLVAPTTNGLLIPQGELSPMPESAGLAYLTGAAPPSGDSIQSNESTITLAENDVTGQTTNKFGLALEDKRGGAFFDDLDLGLADGVEYDDQQIDENDPYDRRKSQYLLKAKLDEIEKALFQFSPKALKSGFDSPVVPTKVQARSSVSSSSTLLGPNGPSPSKSSLKPSRHRNASQSSFKGDDTVWPAVPYSTIASDSSRNSTDDDPSIVVPKWTLNGVSPVTPRSPYVGKKGSPTVASEETQARKHHAAENNQHPYVQSSSYESSIIPLSPDPFSRYPSNTTDEYKNTSKGPKLVVQTRDSSLSNFNQSENLASTPSSRFSMDSTLSETGASISQSQKGTQRGSSIVSVKSIRRLWRKSTKGSVSGMPSLVPSGKISPQLPPRVSVSKEVPTPLQSPSSNEIIPPPTPSLPSLPSSRAASRAESSTEYLRLDQEAKYPLRYNDISPPPQPATPLALAPRSSSPSVPSPHNSPMDKSGSGRKSILKTWKSSTSSSFPPNHDPVRATPDHQYGESVSTTVTRKKRPSVFDTASSLMRGSVASSLYDIPPSPSLPYQFSNNSVPHGKNSKQPTELTRQAPAAGSFSSTDSSPPIVSPIATSPRHGAAIIRRTSSESYRSRCSLDNAQFELVSPKLDPQGIQSSLSYPYNELDR